MAAVSQRLVSRQVREQVRVQLPDTVAVSCTCPGTDEITDPRLLLLWRIAEMLTGHPIRLFRVGPGGAPVEIPVSAGASGTVRVDRQETRIEQQTLEFSAEGTVKTRDGREFRFSVDLHLDRRFVSVGSANTKDPLFLDLGLLVQDRNSDGVINDASELFGATTGDGFGELAAQDADGNGWIDEADPVFGTLRVRLPDSDGLYTLKDLGVGALYTSSAAGDFDLRDAGDNLVGQIRRSGIYLSEDGRPGLLQQIDLAL